MGTKSLLATETYSYLKKYVGHNDLKGTYFLPVSSEETREAEELIGISLPDQLKKFYREIGAGILSCGEKYPEMLADSLTNEVLPPLVAARFSKGILQWEAQENWMSESTYELLEPGDLPFIQVGDSDYFLIMKPKLDNPNAVYDMRGHLIESSFEKFIWRLYYEDPSYYAKDW